MEIVIKGDAKEIASLVLALQGQRNQKIALKLGGEELATTMLDNPR